MALFDLICEHDGYQVQNMVLLPSEEKPPCPRCGETLVCDWSGGQAPGMIADSIPGGIDIKHGICNEDGTPKRYYSKSDMKHAAAAKGLVNAVEHVGSPGSDKNPHTTRWT